MLKLSYGSIWPIWPWTDTNYIEWVFYCWWMKLSLIWLEYSQAVFIEIEGGFLIFSLEKSCDPTIIVEVLPVMADIVRIRSMLEQNIRRFSCFFIPPLT